MNKSIYWHTLCMLFAVMLMIPVEGVCQQRYSVAVCDWMILKRQKLGEFLLAKQIGADGVELDMGALGQREAFDNKMRDPHFQQLFRHTADSLGIAVPSVAMSGFFAQNFIIRHNYRDLVQDCLNTMKVFDAKVAFLPLGGCGTGWEKAGTAHDELVRRLHEIGEMAAREGVTIGIRTGLDAKANIRLLKEVDSKGIRIYYNLQDAVDNHRNPYKELRKLGKKRVVQIHASLTDSVTLDRDPRIDLPRFKKTLDKMDWHGWLVVERSRDITRVKDVIYNFGTNVAALKR